MSGEHILVVHDNPVRAKLLTVILEDAGYTVSETRPEGAASARPPALVLMETHWPEADADRLRRVREVCGDRDVPVLAIPSADAAGQDGATGVRGYDGVLPTPLDARTLPEAIRRFLGGRTGPAVEPDVMDSDAFLDRCEGDPEMIAELVQIYLDRRVGLLESIRAGLVEGNAGAVAAGAHSLRGYFINFSAGRVSALARELEERARVGELDDGAVLLDRIADETAVLDARLESLVGEVTS